MKVQNDDLLDLTKILNTMLDLNDHRAVDVASTAQVTEARVEELVLRYEGQVFHTNRNTGITLFWAPASKSDLGDLPNLVLAKY